ncbi:MAG TPA: response regulator transcription factor [Propionibacteriaceae bacterium]|nr:response regulator transcription factor [Propionibacteriaceae bacterium]
MTTVLVADDQALMRAGLRRLIESEPDLDVVAEAPDGAEAVRACREHHPDVALLDIRMPRLDGIQATREIVAASSTRVVLLTLFDLDEYVYDGLRAGATGFLLKDSPPAQLLAAIRAAAGGDALIEPRVTRRLLEEFVGQRMEPLDVPGIGTLTEREREVWTLLAAGQSNAEIAGALFLGEATVKTHVGNLFAKLGTRDRVQAVVLAYEAGIVRPGRPPAPRA